MLSDLDLAASAHFGEMSGCCKNLRRWLDCLGMDMATATLSFQEPP